MKRIYMLPLILALSLFTSSLALGFQDIEADPGQASIQALKDQGILSGVDSQVFAPKTALTYAQAVHLMVKSFGLNLDQINFVKEPQAKDFFTGIPNDAWYAQDFIIAHMNGITLAKDVDPNAAMTKEQYAELLCQALLTKGDYAFIQIFILLGDEDQVDPGFMQSIQTLLIAKIAGLDKEQNFNPKRSITRSEGAVWLHQALLFVKKQEELSNNPPQEAEEKIDVVVEAVNNEVNKVTLVRSERFSMGYGISVDSIAYQDQKAVIQYRLHEPLPDHMYPAIVVEVKMVTYVPSQYEVEIQQLHESVSSQNAD